MSSDARLQQIFNNMGRVVHYADGAFASVVLNGCQKVANGTGYKITLDNRTAINQETSGNTLENNIYGTTKFAQRISLLNARNLDSVEVSIEKNGSPANGLTVEIQEGDAATGPDGTVVGTAITKAAGDITAHNWYSFAVNAPLEADKDYFIVMYMAGGGGDNSNKYYIYA